MNSTNIEKRDQEIDLNNAKGWDSFHVNLEMTCGLEKQDERYQSLWDEYDNSYHSNHLPTMIMKILYR